MASEGALIIVRELYEVLQLPRSEDTADSVPQMLTSLKHFVSSPHARVRFYAVRSVGLLARDYTSEISDHTWISQAQRRLARGENEGDLDNAKILADALAALIGTEITDEPVSVPTSAMPRVPPAVATSLFRLLPITDDGDSPGQHGGSGVFFSAADISDQMASELQLAIVKIGGVISAFINADFLVLTTRGNVLDGNLFGDLRKVVERVSERLFTIEEISDQCLESTTLATEEDSAYLDDDERFAARAQKQFPTFFSAAYASRGLSSVQRHMADMEIIEAPAETVAAPATTGTGVIGGFFRRLFS